MFLQFDLVAHQPLVRRENLLNGAAPSVRPHGETDPGLPAVCVQ